MPNCARARSGRKALVDANYSVAEAEFTKAFERCHKDSRCRLFSGVRAHFGPFSRGPWHICGCGPQGKLNPGGSPVSALLFPRHNKILILRSLIPVKLLRGTSASIELLEKYGMVQFVELTRAVLVGDLKLMTQELDKYQTDFVRCTCHRSALPRRFPSVASTGVFWGDTAMVQRFTCFTLPCVWVACRGALSGYGKVAVHRLPKSVPKSVRLCFSKAACAT